MEHHGADQEEDQRAVPEEYPDAFHSGAFPAVPCAASELVVNLGGPDHQQDEDRRRRERRDEEKDAAVGNKVSKQAHRHGGNHVPCRVERLIAALADVECGASHDPQRHGADGGEKDAGRAAKQDLRAHDRPEPWKQRDQQRSRSQRGNGHAHQRTLRAQKVNQRAGRRLRENARDAAHCKRESYTLFVPSVAGEIDGEERPHPRLHVGKQEIEPIEAAQCSPRRTHLGLRGCVGLGRSLHVLRTSGGRGSFQAFKLQRHARATVCSHSKMDATASVEPIL